MTPPHDRPPARKALAVGASVAFAALLGVAIAGALGKVRVPPPSPAVVAAPEVAKQPPPPPERFEEEILRLGRNETISVALVRAGVGAADLTAAIQALEGVFPFRKARAGDQLRVERRAGEPTLHRLSIRQGPIDEWLVERGKTGALTASKRDVTVRKEVARVAVTVRNSLYGSILAAHEDPGLAVLAADVLAWDVDFYQDVRNGDRMRVVVEKVFADDRFVKFGDVLATEYVGGATGRKRLFRYTDPEGKTSYYDDDGQSAQRGFLRSPLKYAQITSGFGSRRHPLKGYVQQHPAIDYGAPMGTPVWSVGDGAVKTAGWLGDCGNAVQIRHRNGLETLYCHLSGVAVHAGAHVNQKQVIGWVGSTGASTGPHLHYGVKRNGAYLNPLALKLPREAPIKREWMDGFREQVGPLRTLLDAEPVAMR
ncbi:MAG TPA: M23 family metallopeptidase [Anaeromyxobacteraceae bacterium]|nr:M23 family metallopeptidase [Anaeromyxobacteraceae bacterium]